MFNGITKIIFLINLLTPFISPAQRVAKGFTAANGEFIGFYEYKPIDYATNSATKYPVIIFLHGIGEKGNGTTDLYKLNCCGIPNYINKGNPMRFYWNGKWESFIVLYPQLGSLYSVWQNFYVDEMIDYAKKNLRVDSNRIVLTGLSMGGAGVWSYASFSQANASKLSGIIPVVANCAMTNGCNIANAKLAVWAMHARDDDVSSPLCAINAIASINACNAAVSPNLTLYDNGGHYVWVRRTFEPAYTYQNPNIYEWAMAQNRGLPPNKKPVALAGNDISVSVTSGIVVLNAAESYDPDGTILRFIWRKLGGPSYGIIANATAPLANLSKLTAPGIYKYELKVVDDRAEWSLDTVIISVGAGLPLPNLSPANVVTRPGN